MESTTPPEGPVGLARCLETVRTGPLLDRLRVFRTCLPLSVPLAVGNLLAVYWGWTIYYRAQFERTAVPLWPFVSDSPNAVLSLALVLAAAWFGLRWRGLDLLAWILNVKVGLWTMFVLLYWYEEFFATDATLRWWLFWLHAGMVAQAFVVHHALRTRRAGWTAWGVVTALVMADLVLDYAPGLGNHPYLPGGPYDFGSVAGIVTTLLTAGVLAAAFALYRPRPSNATPA